MNIAWRITYSFDNLFTFSITSTAGSKIVAARTLKPTNSRVARYHYACTPLLITSPWKCNWILTVPWLLENFIEIEVWCGNVWTILGRVKDILLLWVSFKGQEGGHVRSRSRRKGTYIFSLSTLQSLLQFNWCMSWFYHSLKGNGLPSLSWFPQVFVFGAMAPNSRWKEVGNKMRSAAINFALL